MAHYTTTIKTLINTGFDFKLDTYPIFDENYRNTLNQKILNHYYENEIGFETPALFRFYLNSKLNEIMPFYNILYEKQLQLLQNIDKNVNITEDFRGTDSKHNTASSSNNSHSETETESSSNSSSSGSSSSKNLFQDTPQGQISQTDIDAQTWATNLTLDSASNENEIEDTSSSSGSSNNTSSNNSTVNENGTNNYIKSIIGNNGGRYNLDILADLQKNLMNVDLMIINDLNELFMQIF